MTENYIKQHHFLWLSPPLCLFMAHYVSLLLIFTKPGGIIHVITTLFCWKITTQRPKHCTLKQESAEVSVTKLELLTVRTLSIQVRSATLIGFKGYHLSLTAHLLLQVDLWRHFSEHLLNTATRSILLMWSQLHFPNSIFESRNIAMSSPLLLSLIILTHECWTPLYEKACNSWETNQFHFALHHSSKIKWTEGRTGFNKVYDMHKNYDFKQNTKRVQLMICHDGA